MEGKPQNGLQQFPLPRGKDYHIFLSYSNEDKELAYNLKDILQTKYGLRCQTFEDFEPGSSIISKIAEGIKVSQKIVYLISNAFNMSQLCITEIDYGIMAAHESPEKNILIPVLVDPPIPQKHRVYNYINARRRNQESIAEDIFEAFKFGSPNTCIPPTVVLPTEDFYNGSLVKIIPGKTKNCLLPKLRFSDDDGKFRIEIKDQNRLMEKAKHAHRILDKVLKETYKTTKCLPLLKVPDLLQEFICHILREKKPMWNDEEIQKEADQIILSTIFQKREILSKWIPIPTSSYRHNTYMQRQCLCQMIEPELIR
ncbi:uncharacterized protein LOC134242432 [Saccostrea cucullata]|uniref:uncharacterized protein LOC134242432 n=1 Tax=Saccostrea cuccullata TaxID=36930 RepID=UPI002ED0FE79